jgi:undecaprenyl-diphosphatase
VTAYQALILGLLQGFTEFLPVSSSGHIALGQELLKISHEGDISFEVFVHFGTFLSVLVVFRKEVLAIFRSFVAAFKSPPSIVTRYRVDEFFRLGVFILVGSIPAAVVGLTFEREVEMLFTDPKLVSVMLMITGLILYLTKFAKPMEGRSIGLGSCAVVGCAQAFAIIPGISRSGSTISTALFAGVSQENSARFSFLLALPVIFGATLMKSSQLVQAPPSSDKLLALSVGTMVAAVSGYAAILLLLNILRRGKFSWFAYYCFIVGVLGVLFVG